MSRQHATPLLLRDGAPTAPLKLTPLSADAAEGAIVEADIQQLVHEHPCLLPIEEIDPTFKGPVAICRELRTPAGPIDNFLVTPSGLPVLVECKLWRNPEGRREVVGQILDYAKELSRWTQPDLQREANSRLGTTGNVLLQKVRAVAPDTDEIAFNDSLTLNLRRGRFLLLIVGDGIREGVEAIAEYLQRHAGLHFSLGLVELPFYRLPDGGRLVAPRILARTENLVRTVVAMPEGMVLEEAEDDQQPNSAPVDPEIEGLAASRQQFWAEFLGVLKLDDPEQPIPKPAREDLLTFMFPAARGSSWLKVYRDIRKNEVGVLLSSSRNSAGEYASQRLADDWPQIAQLLNGTAQLSTDAFGRAQIGDRRGFGSVEKADRQQAFAWLAERVNTFVNVLRPRVRSAVADYLAGQSGG